METLSVTAPQPKNAAAVRVVTLFFFALCDKIVKYALSHYPFVGYQKK
jgi:hypothetical protein